MDKNNQQSQVVIYQTKDGQTKVNVQFQDETVWLTQKLMAELFEVSIPTINEHLKNIFSTGELEEKSVIRNFRISASDDKQTKEFFATVQNKMHFAVHGWTAAEIISKRANSKKPLMGLTSFKDKYITAQDIKIAKNYLKENELKQLNLIVSLFLDFAELQATNERPMKMIDWIKKLDEFIKLSEKKLLTNAGKISEEKAGQKAEAEFEKYRKERDKKYISDFDKEVKKLFKK